MPSQSIYEVLISCGGTGLDVRVNDGPLYTSTDTTAGDIELVANGWLHHGRNTISARLIRQASGGSVSPHLSVDIAVFERERGQERQQRRHLLSFSYRFAELSEHTPATDGTFGSSDFEADVDFPEWSWTASPAIPDTPDTFASLLGELDIFHGLLAARDINGIGARLRVRDREIALAHYRSEQEQNDETVRDFLFLTGDDDMTLEPRETKDLRLRLFGGGRLARIEDGDRESPIYYLSLDESRVRFVPLLFSLTRDRRWQIVR